jgi:acyl carrier protein
MVMQALGVDVLADAVDIADAGQLHSLLQRIKATMPPLRGIIHGAMVLDDGLLTGLTAERLQRVFAPKISGALNLDAETRDIPLDFFVMLSSVSSLVGNVGQGNYAAANAFLDGFAEYRRSRGLPAMTINWGALAEIGVAARNVQVEQALHAAGLRSMLVDHALFALGQALRLNLPQIGIFQVDWGRWRALHPAGASAALFEALFAEQSESADGAGLDPHQQLLHRLAVLDPQERLDYMQLLLSEELARVLQMPATQIDVQQSVMTLGIDSLMAVELQTALQTKFALKLSAMELTRGLSVAQLAARLLGGLTSDLEALRTAAAVPEQVLDAVLETEMAGVSVAELEHMVKKAVAGKE